MTNFDLNAKHHQSRVLTDWVRSRPGAAERVGIQNAVGVISSSEVEGMRALFAPLNSASGFAVNDFTAMQVTAVFACLAVLSGSILQLPLHEYTSRLGGLPERADKTQLWWLLNESPHARWTAASWKEWIVKCVMLRGDQHTEIIRSRAASSGGEIIGFHPHHPDYVNTRRVNDRLVYDIRDQETGKLKTVDQDDMLHFSGFGFNGIRSLSAIQNAAKNAIGNSLAAAEYSGRSIGEGAMPQIALSYPNKLNADQSKLLRDNFVATYTGVGSRKLPLVMTEGGTAVPLSISPVDMELLESRRFERENIYQALGVPPVLVGDNSKTTSFGTGVEQVTIAYVRYGLKPHLCRWEEELNRKLFRKAGRYIEFELDGLLRGDSKAQAEVFRSSLGGPGTGDGYMTVNEVRKLRNLPPVPNGDEPFRAQRNKTTSGKKE